MTKYVIGPDVALRLAQEDVVIPDVCEKTDKRPDRQPARQSLVGSNKNGLQDLGYCRKGGYFSHQASTGSLPLAYPVRHRHHHLAPHHLPLHVRVRIAHPCGCASTDRPVRAAPALPATFHSRDAARSRRR